MGWGSEVVLQVVVVAASVTISKPSEEMGTESNHKVRKRLVGVPENVQVVYPEVMTTEEPWYGSKTLMEYFSLMEYAHSLGSSGKVARRGTAVMVSLYAV